MSRTEESDYSSAGPSEPTSIDETIEFINRHLHAANTGIEKLREQLQSPRRELEQLQTQLQQTEAAARAEHCALRATFDSLSKEIKNYRAFDKKLQFEKKSSDELLVTNQFLREKIEGLQEKEIAMMELKSRRAALEEENKDLQQQLDLLLEKVPSDLEEKYNTVFKEAERLHKENSDKMAQVTMLRDRYRQNAALCEAYGDMKTEKEQLSQENDRLRQEIQEFDRKMLHQNTILKMTDTLKASHEAVNWENTTLRWELKRLNTEYENVKDFCESYNESLSRFKGMKKESDDLRKQIKEVSKQLQSAEVFKDKCKELEAEKKSAKLQLGCLMKTHSEKRKKLAKEEAWKDKHNKLKEQVDALRQINCEIGKDIQACSAKLEYLNNIKVRHKLLETDKKKLVDQQNMLRKNLRELEKQFSKQRVQMEKNEGLNLDINNLTTDNYVLWEKFETLSKSLQDEDVLGITFNSLKVKKNAMKQQNKTLHKEVQKLTKKLDEEKRLEEQ